MCKTICLLTFFLTTPLIAHQPTFFNSQHSLETISFINDKEGNEKPPLNITRITGEICTGGLLGFGCGLATGYIGYCFDKGESDFPISSEMALCSFFGYALGSAVGVYVVGNIGNETGSLWSTMFGSFICGLPAIFVASNTENPSLYYATAIFAPIGAIIGFNISREYKKVSYSHSGLLHNNEKGIYLLCPSIQFSTSTQKGDNLKYNVNILSISF